LLDLGPTETRIHKLRSKKGTLIAALIDPDEFSPKRAGETARLAERAGASIILVGGSTVADQTRLDAVVRDIKRHITTSPVVLFPNNITGISKYADAILFSSLLNSNNPYFLIGAQALGSMQIYRDRLETIPMGYLVFGNTSAAGFIGQVNSIPAAKPTLAVIYALAASYMGMRVLYLEAGSGSAETITLPTVKAVRKYFGGLLIVGGGITSPEKAKEIAKAGPDVLVIGNLLQVPGFEKTLREMAAVIKRQV
jgi:phosphoglycerol geranylgeranyltransferase